ncbi:uncharacterized protein BKCO1_1800049 [Diplodia corticola]|uniref:Cupin 2 conserved barrel domain-containing protein n=1 Tax=Diplodia corticola TaxID=236234 RepID=A0A1J9RRP2_9PEZI|nr:uncharacterized protein BKCO1_1800049 [Diplodia corticola]OJD35203.1 hypothetical protein BKCO1_1800049 [Diplodia corticola]
MLSGDAKLTSVIKRPLPDAVTYDLSHSDYVVVTLPAGSTWSSGLHWHERHVEYLRVIKGNIRVRLGDTVQIISAPESAGVREIKVEKNTHHEWSREAVDGEDVVVMERTEPQDGEKAIFFWNLNGVVLDAPKTPKTTLDQFLREIRLHLELFTIFRSLDNFPVFLDLAGSRAGGYLKSRQPSLPLLVEWFTTHFLLEAAAVLAVIWGIEPVQRKYTPQDAFNHWQGRDSGKPKCD